MLSTLIYNICHLGLQVLLVLDPQTEPWEAAILPHETSHKVKTQFNPCLFPVTVHDAMIAPLHDVTVHVHHLHHVVIHLHHLHTLSTPGPFYKADPPVHHRSTRLFPQFTTILQGCSPSSPPSFYTAGPPSSTGCSPCSPPFYNDHGWLLSLWTPAGGSLEQGTREQRSG